jgi:DNA-binding transcriptional regulator LsrR (DeoR family)
MESDKNKLIYKVLQNYYERGLTQQEIAVKYGISRVKVSRLITKALSDKIVQIKIHIPDDPAGDLEQKLEEIFGLKEAIVIPVNSENIFKEVGEALAGYLLSRLQGNELIGITWGRSLLAAVNALTSMDYPDIRVVQMLGGLGNPGSDTHGTELAVRTAGIFNARARLLNSPGIVETRELRDALMENLQVSDTLKLAEKIDIALVGIGTLNTDSLIVEQSSIISRAETRRLLKKGAVGDVGLRFFDKDGKIIDDEINERVIGLTPAQIKKIPRVVGVAGGEKKHLPILAALKGKLVNVLITDIETAQFLVDEHSKT